MFNIAAISRLLWVRNMFFDPLSLLLMASEWTNMAVHPNTVLKTFKLFSLFVSLYKLNPCVAFTLYEELVQRLRSFPQAV